MAAATTCRDVVDFGFTGPGRGLDFRLGNPDEKATTPIMHTTRLILVFPTR